MKFRLATLLLLGAVSAAPAQDMGSGLNNPAPSTSSGGSGTVTSVSVATANGLSGSVANPTTTPALTLTYTPSGDCTGAAGALTCTKTNGAAFGALATVTPGTGVATALGVNVGTAGAPVVNGGALGTPSSGTGTNLTGIPIDGGTINTLPFSRGGCNATTIAGCQGNLQLGMMSIEIAGANFNATNGTDIAHFTPVLPTGTTGYQVQGLKIFNCTAAITTAHVGLFTAAGATGTTVLGNTVGTPTAQGPNAAASLQTINGSTTIWYNSADLFLNLITQQGSAVTCTVDMLLFII